MRFWNIESLKTQLRTGDLDHKSATLYLLAIGLLMTASSWIPTEEFSFWDWFDASVDTVFFVAGTVWVFRSNGGSAGRDFVNRYLALSWVLAIRLFFLVFVPLVLAIGILFEILEIPDVQEPDAGISMIVAGWLVLYYWRLNRHFLDLRENNAA